MDDTELELLELVLPSSGRPKGTRMSPCPIAASFFFLPTTDIVDLNTLLPQCADDIATLKPAFDPAILRYTAVVASSIQEVEVVRAL